MKNGIFVVLPPGELSAPRQSVTTFGPTPVMQDLLCGPIETHFWIAVDTCSAVGHGHCDVVRSSIYFDPEVTDALIEIANGLAYLMHTAKLRMRDQPRTEYKSVR